MTLRLNSFRSYLFIPSGNERFISKALSASKREAPDAIILDLEDSIPVNEKDTARSKLSSSIESIGKKIAVAVRVNASDTPFFDKDIIAAAREDIFAIFLPKTTGIRDIELAQSLMNYSLKKKGRKKGSIKLIPMVENAAGASSLKEICSYNADIAAVGFGAGDYALDMGLPWTKEGYEYQIARMLIPLEARAAERTAIDGVFMDLNDKESFRRDCMLSRRFGYSGRMVVHPDQVTIANEVYQPSKEEIEWAQRVVVAYEEAGKRGQGAVKVDGYLVDVLHYKLAKRILSETGKQNRQT
ncbi:MAG: CoA ester lyase [Conexivisphaerales archaeon]